MRLEFHPEAAMEFSQAAEFYELQIPGLRDRFAAEVQMKTCASRPLRTSGDGPDTGKGASGADA